MGRMGEKTTGTKFQELENKWITEKNESGKEVPRRLRDWLHQESQEVGVNGSLNQGDSLKGRLRSCCHPRRP